MRLNFLFFSEQQLENLHYIFDELVEHSYKVNDIHSELFHSNYEKAVLEKNVDNLWSEIN